MIRVLLFAWIITLGSFNSMLVFTNATLHCLICHLLELRYRQLPVKTITKRVVLISLYVARN